MTDVNKNKVIGKEHWINCKSCDKKVYCWLSQIKIGKKYCSHSCAMRGNKINKGRILSEEVKQKKRDYKHTVKAKIKISKAVKKRMSDPLEIKKVLGNRGKSSLEIKFENLVNDIGIPYKFVGDGEFIIARKCPDFINTNGERIAVEVYYRRHKNNFRNGLESWKADRFKLFSSEGWELIFFDETEVKMEIIKQKLCLEEVPKLPTLQ